MARSRRALVALLGAALLLGAPAALRLTHPARYPAKARGRLMTQGQAGFQHTAAVKYLFTVEGASFTIEGELGESERLVDVWYDPDDPRDCSFQPERTSTAGRVAAALAVACLLAAGGVLLTSGRDS